MSRSVTTIKKKSGGIEIAAIILSAGIGTRIKSSEPRSLIKIQNKSLIEHQIHVLKHTFKKVEIIGVFGPHIDKIVKKFNKDIRIVENQLYTTTNNSESLRLGMNNTSMDNILFLHGDLLFTESILENADFSKSFLLLDANGDMDDKEVGVTISKDRASILSYGLKKKWCQMCFLTGKELKILRSFFLKMDDKEKKMLSFELVNKIIELGGVFELYENKDSKIVEIDCIKDIPNEYFNMQRR